MQATTKKILIPLVLLLTLSFISLVPLVKADTVVYGNENTEATAPNSGFNGYTFCSNRFQVTVDDAYATEIHVYVSGGGASLYAAIYNDNAGVPSSRVVLSAETGYSGGGWKTIDITDTALTNGNYYWLAVRDTDAAALRHGSGAGGYYQNGVPAASFSGSAYSCNPISIHAVVSYTAATPTPTPTPSPTPAPTTYPANNTNLIAVDCGHWYTDSDWQLAPIRTMIINQSVTLNDLPSWQVPLSTADWGVDHAGLSISSGQTIYYSFYIKTGAATLPEDIDSPIAGGRIGIDIYGANGASRGLSNPDGSGGATWSYNTYVPFGTSEWTQVTMNFTVQSTYIANQVTHSQPIGTSFAPTFFIPWIQTWSSTEGTDEHGTAWFSNPTLYIDMQSSPEPTASPAPATVNNTVINPVYILLGLAGMGIVLYQVIKGKN